MTQFLTLGYLVSSCFRKCPLLDVMVISYSVSATLPKVIYLGKQCDCAVVGTFGAVDLYDTTALWTFNLDTELTVR